MAQVDTVHNPSAAPSRNEINAASLANLMSLITVLGVLTLAELLTTTYRPETGMLLHSVLLVGLLVRAAMITSQSMQRLLLSLALCPLIRLLSLSLPLGDLPLALWYIVISIPLFVAAFVIIRMMGLVPKDVGFSFRYSQLPLHLLIIGTGIAFGIIEYLILQTTPLLDTLDLGAVVITVLSLTIGTGLMEELIFRGIIQCSLQPIVGSFRSIVISALVFAILHIGWQSFIDLVFVFAVGVFWGWVFVKTRSIISITLSHSLTNIMLFIVLPNLFPIARTAEAEQQLRQVSLAGVSGASQFALQLQSTDQLLFEPEHLLAFVGFSVLILLLTSAFYAPRRSQNRQL